MVQSVIVSRNSYSQVSSWNLFHEQKPATHYIYLPLQIRSSQKLCEKLEKFSLRKYNQNSAMQFGELPKPGESILLAFVIPKCSSSMSACSTQALEFLIWKSPLDPAQAICTEILGCRMTLSSSHEWQSWMCSTLFDRPSDQNAP